MLACAYLDEFSFSMYGIDKKTYEYVNGGSMIFEENKNALLSNVGWDSLRNSDLICGGCDHVYSWEDALV